MKIRRTVKKLSAFITLEAESKEETELLRVLFNGEGPERYHKHSFGYNDKIKKTPRGMTPDEWSKYLSEQAKKLVLTFKLSQILQEESEEECQERINDEKALHKLGLDELLHILVKLSVLEIVP